MDIAQIERIMKILKESKLPRDPSVILGKSEAVDRLADIEQKMESYKRHIEKQVKSGAKGVDHSFEKEKIVEEIFAYIRDNIAFSASMGNQQVINQLLSTLPQLIKEGEQKNKDYLNNVILMRILDILFEQGLEKQSSLERPKLNEDLSKVKIFIHFGFSDKAQAELQPISNPASYKLQSIHQLLESTLKKLPKDNKTAQIDSKTLELMLKDYSKKLEEMADIVSQKKPKSTFEPPDPKKWPAREQMLKTVEYVIEVAKFHPDNHCRELAKASLKKWEKDKHIGPHVKYTLEPFLKSEKQSKQQFKTMTSAAHKPARKP